MLLKIISKYAYMFSIEFGTPLFTRYEKILIYMGNYYTNNFIYFRVNSSTNAFIDVHASS